MSYYKFTFKYQNESISKFKISITHLIKIYQEEIDNYNRYALGKIPDNAPRHDQQRAIQSILNRLENALKTQNDIEFDDSSYISSFSGRIIAKNNFENVECLKCDKVYKIQEIKKDKWQNGESLSASGGVSLFCPKDHFLYGLMEWNS